MNKKRVRMIVDMDVDPERIDGAIWYVQQQLLSIRSLANDTGIRGWPVIIDTQVDGKRWESKWPE